MAKINDRVWQKEVKTLIDICWACYPDTVNQWAKDAGVAPGTIWNLARGKTKSPHYRTLYRISAAAGVPIQLLNNAVRIARAAA